MYSYSGKLTLIDSGNKKDADRRQLCGFFGITQTPLTAKQA